MESLAAGKPVLAWPQMAEQHLNAHHVTHIIGAGGRITAAGGAGAVVGRAEVEHKIRRLMDAGDSDEAARVARKTAELWIGRSSALLGRCTARKGTQGAAGGGGAHGRGAMGLGCVLELEQRAPLARTRARTREREGIWPGGIWIDPEEGGDLFERSGWAGGEIEEKVGGRIRQILRKEGK